MEGIAVRELTKVYRVHERDAGLGAALRSLVRRKYREVRAVGGVSFDVAPGEVVGFLGPNGAGKTTTLKMLSGLLYPTSGEARVLAHVPWRREKEYLRRISMVMGNRSQLIWDIPAIDSFRVNQAVYRIPDAQYQQILGELTELLDLGALLNKQVRSLSLGERMKCELAASLLHRPAVLFLDEPTIGVDVTMQTRIRRFITEYNRLHGATIILTSHYMADVTALCRRVIVIHHGRILYDGDLDALVERMAPFKVIEIDLEHEPDGLDPSRYGELIRREGQKLALQVPKAETPAVTARLLAELPVLDLSVEDPPIEEVIDRVFQEPGAPAVQPAAEGAVA
jgi:ABC-2 type transport system ATP-binding protein